MEIWIGLVMFAALLALLVIGVPVAFALFAIAIGSLWAWWPPPSGARSRASR